MLENLPPAGRHHGYVVISVHPLVAVNPSWNRDPLAATNYVWAGRSWSWDYNNAERHDTRENAQAVVDRLAARGQHRARIVSARVDGH